MIYQPNVLRRCSGCKELKLASGFSRDRHAKDGLCVRCKVCNHKASERFHRDNPEYRRDYQRYYRIQRPGEEATYARRRRAENPERFRAQARSRYAADSQSRRQRERDYRRKHPDIARERDRQQRRRKAESDPDFYKKKYRRDRYANLDRARQRGRQYRLLRAARKHSKPAAFDATDWQRCLDYWHNLCCYCSERPAAHADHFIPLASPDCPGTIPTNILPACQYCNQSKNHRSADQWLTWKFGADQAHETLALIRQYFEWLITQD